MYVLEGIVLALQFFFDKVSHLKHPSEHPKEGFTNLGVPLSPLHTNSLE